MFTYTTTRSYVKNDSLVSQIDAACLSTDEKPTIGIANGSSCVEMDTKKVYFFDETNSVWIPFT